MESNTTSYTIISGHRRIEFARTYLQQNTIDCRVIKKDIDAHLLFDIILEDLASPTALSLAEKSRFLSIASGFFETTQLAPLFFKKLGINRKQSFLKDLFHLLDQDDSFIEQAHNGLIEEQMLSELLRLKEKDRSALITLFSALNLGAGKQKKTVNLLRDAAYKEGASIKDYIEGKEVRAITEDETLNVPQKIQHLDRYLQQKISPQSLNAENEFADQVKALKLEKNQTISHSPAFEKNTVILSTEFESLEECSIFLQKPN